MLSTLGTVFGGILAAFSARMLAIICLIFSGWMYFVGKGAGIDECERDFAVQHTEQLAKIEAQRRQKEREAERIIRETQRESARLDQLHRREIDSLKAALRAAEEWASDRVPDPVTRHTYGVRESGKD